MIIFNIRFCQYHNGCRSRLPCKGEIPFKALWIEIVIERLHDEYIVEICGNSLFAAAGRGIPAGEKCPAGKRFYDTAVTIGLIAYEHKISRGREFLGAAVIFLCFQPAACFSIFADQFIPLSVDSGHSCRDTLCILRHHIWHKAVIC